MRLGIIFCVFTFLPGCCFVRVGPVAPPNRNVQQRNFENRPNINDNVQPEPVKPTFFELPGGKFSFLEQRLKERQIYDVGIIGFQSKSTFREAPGEGAALIGFNVGLRPFFNNQVIDVLQPIFLTRNGEKLGAWIGKPAENPTSVKAKPGYVVGTINIRTGLSIDGFALKYFKLDNNRFDLDDHYASAWVGSQKGGSPATIAEAGVLAVGVCGHRDDKGHPCSLGLIAARLPD